MLSGESTEELMEVEVMQCRCDELTILAVEEWKVAVVHSAVMGNLEEVLVQCGGWWGLLDSSSGCGVGSVFVDKMGLEVVPVFE
jgi:hypothetical protein